MFTIENLEIKEGNGTKWSASRDYDGNYTCYQDGGGAFDLELNDEKWTLRNDAPHSSQYRTRKKFLQALAMGTHESPIIAETTTTEQPSLANALMWAVINYKKKGWRTRDCFSESMTMKKVAA